MHDAKYLIGFRQYLNSLHSYQDLLQIVRESLTWQSEDIQVMIALCGEDPRPALIREHLDTAVDVYDYSSLRLSAMPLVKRFVADYRDDHKVIVIYYSPDAEGLTYPIDLFTNIAAFMNYEHLGVSDSDFQIPYSEIRRMLRFHVEQSDEKHPCVTFPKRRRRSLDAENYPINRWAMEDIENLYVYFLSNIRFLDMKLDIQSGLFFTNRMANILLDFQRVGKWVGTLHLAISLLRQRNVRAFQEIVDTNQQHESTINFRVQCGKIEELYDYYLIPMENIIRIALDNPRKYLMEDWCESLKQHEIEEILTNLYQSYQKMERPALAPTPIKLTPEI